MARWKTYVFMSFVAARQAFMQWGVMAGYVSFCTVVLLIFSFIWKGAQLHTDITGNDIYWYFVVTECIVLSIPSMHREMAQDIRNHIPMHWHHRPVSYVALRVAQGIGQVVVRFGVLGVWGMALAWWLSKTSPMHYPGLLVALPLALGAAVVGVLFEACMGLSSYWIQDNAPLFWIWQKLLFVLGGLFLPLEFYPVWLQKLAYVLPFAALLHEPARAALGASAHTLWLTLMHLLGWGGIAGALLYGLAQAGHRRQATAESRA